MIIAYLSILSHEWGMVDIVDDLTSLLISSRLLIRRSLVRAQVEEPLQALRHKQSLLTKMNLPLFDVPLSRSIMRP